MNECRIPQESNEIVVFSCQLLMLSLTIHALSSRELLFFTNLVVNQHFINLRDLWFFFILMIVYVTCFIRMQKAGKNKQVNKELWELHRLWLVKGRTFLSLSREMQYSKSMKQKFRFLQYMMWVAKVRWCFP